jgi:hypothetical protein
MSAREYAIEQINTLPEAIIEKVLDYIAFQKHRFGFGDETDYLMSIPGMMEKIEAASNEPLSEGIPIEELWTSTSV